MSSDPFEIEAPRPGAVFYEQVVHPENIALLEGDERARKLSSKSLKKLQRKLKELQRLLDMADYDRQTQRYKALRDAYQRAKERLHTSEDETDKQRTRVFMARCKKAAQQIYQQLESARPHAAMRQRLQMRLDEHHVALRNEKLYEELRKEMRREVNYFEEQMIRRWSALGYREVVHIGDKQIVHRPQIEDVYVAEDEIHYKIRVSSIGVWGNTIHYLPQAVKAWDLVTPETLRELEAACERPVSSPHSAPEYGGENRDFSNGAWLSVHRIGMNGGLFNYIELNQILKKYNQAKRHKFPMPFGVRRGRKINYCFLDEHPHVFVDGQTFAGKTNAIVQGLCTLIQMHSPDELRIVLVDLKRGGDLNPFIEIPHLITFEEGTVIKSPESLQTVLERMVVLMYARMKLISEITVDIKKYNERVPPEQQLPRIVMVIDEYSATKMNLTAKKRIDQCCVVLSTQARAAGIHLVIGNQQPYADTVPKEVRGNITFKLSGRQMSQGASMSAMGSARATRIDKIPGRMVCNDGHEEFDVQIAYATEADIYQAVQAAKNYPAPQSDVWLLDDTQEVIPQRVFNEELLIELALSNFGGTLAGRKMWEFLKADGLDVSLNKVLSTVKEIVAKGTVAHHGITYEMKKPGNRYVLSPITSQHHQATHIPIGDVDTEVKHEDENQEVKV